MTESKPEYKTRCKGSGKIYYKKDLEFNSRGCANCPYCQKLIKPKQTRAKRERFKFPNHSPEPDKIKYIISKTTVNGKKMFDLHTCPTPSGEGGQTLKYLSLETPEDKLIQIAKSLGAEEVEIIE